MSMEKQTAIKKGGVQFFEGDRVKGTIGYSRGNKTTGMRPVVVTGTITHNKSVGEYVLWSDDGSQFKLSGFTSLEKLENE